jgi:MFS family permease
LGFWGRFSDRLGNRIVMIITSSLIPLLPVLWILSADYAYLFGVQIVSGIAWSGFSLSTANYLYDITTFAPTKAIIVDPRFETAG